MVPIWLCLLGSTGFNHFVPTMILGNWHSAGAIWANGRYPIEYPLTCLRLKLKVYVCRSVGPERKIPSNYCIITEKRVELYFFFNVVNNVRACHMTHILFCTSGSSFLGILAAVMSEMSHEIASC